MALYSLLVCVPMELDALLGMATLAACAHHSAPERAGSKEAPAVWRAKTAAARASVKQRGRAPQGIQ
eukprot:CAMPEP_0180520922 /NCGR_PEP_ID=MMETSP1036_2-20121128/56533_1 /TAXON_ID=632150 /ORGANISM="Azadinium spinosum, Strain 3D9" /LENGTH=66 /DNA_ID=CAMNT_0022533467 /DNA_START=95 /DNA_END=293 /DNA_ORIENTATION=+